jgi:hypothetical protein
MLASLAATVGCPRRVPVAGRSRLHFSPAPTSCCTRSGGSTRAWSCHEKFIVDIKLLLEQRHEWTTPRLHELHEEEFVVCPRVKLDD